MTVYRVIKTLNRLHHHHVLKNLNMLHFDHFITFADPKQHDETISRLDMTSKKLEVISNLQNLWHKPCDA